MADGDQVTAMVQDPDFVKLPPDEQRKALAAHDPMFQNVERADLLRFVQAHQAPKAPVAPMGVPAEQMQQSSAPNYVRGATAALPVVGGIGGAVAGAPAFGGGAVVGGALGAAGGEQARQTINNLTFGDPTSLGEVGLAGAIGGASEIPGVIAQGYGNLLLKRLAQAKAPSQVGDVLQAFKSVNPAAGTKAGLQEGLEMANKKLSAQLTQVLRGAQGTVDFDQVISQPALQQAAQEDAAFARGTRASGSRVTNIVKDAIAAAKSNAGIRGNTATAEQLASFQQEIQDRAFNVGKKYPTVGAVAQRIMKENLYADAGNSLRILTGGRATPILSQMTDVYAGISALRGVGSLGKFGPISVSAALNPRITAILSPGVTAAGGAMATQAAPLVKKTVNAVTQ